MVAYNWYECKLTSTIIFPTAETYCFDTYHFWTHDAKYFMCIFQAKLVFFMKTCSSTGDKPYSA